MRASSQRGRFLCASAGLAFVLCGACAGHGDPSHPPGGDAGQAPDGGPPPSDAGTDAGTDETGPDPVGDPTGNPSSYDLIDAAKAAGTVTEEQALLYKLYVDTADPALPAVYRGDDTGLIEGDAHAQVVAYIDRIGPANVPAATLDEMWPFFVPAYFEGSWWHRQHPTLRSAAAPGPNCRAWEGLCPTLASWSSVEGTHVVVWYLTVNAAVDGARASLLVQDIDTKIWPTLTSLMGTPMSDVGTGIPAKTDSRLDVMLIDMPADLEGRTDPSILKCKAAPAHIYLKRSLPYHGLTANAAHELMHAIQFSYDTAADCLLDYPILMDATAVWATNYADRTNDWEHTYAKHYLSGGHTTLPFDDRTAPPQFKYGAYLLPLYLESRFGPSIIKDIWDATLRYSSELFAIDSALVGRGSSFAEVWPGFIAENWNQDGIAATNYLHADRIPNVPPDVPRVEASDTLVLPASGNRVLAQDVSIAHAAAMYRRVIINQADARSVVIFNGLKFAAESFDLTGLGDTLTFTGLGVRERSGVSMQVYLKVNGAWQSAAHDLSNVMALTVCRDDPAGKIEEIIFMYGNAEISPSMPNYPALVPRASGPGLLATNVGCRDWNGNIDLARTIPGGQETLKISNIVLKNLVPTAAPQPGPAITAYPLAENDVVTIGPGYGYATASGTAVWSYDGATTFCVQKGTRTFSIGNPTVARHSFSNWAPPGAVAHGAGLTGFLEALSSSPLSYVETCQGMPPQTFPWFSTLNVFVIPNDPKIRLADDGLSIHGTGAPGDPTTTGTWSFTASTR